MSTHDRGRDNPTARRLVLRKIARPEQASTEGARALPALRPPAARPALVLEEDDLEEEPATIVEATPVPAAPPAPRPSFERYAQADVAPPLPPPRPMAQSHTSVPPMVATVITPLPTVLDSPRSSLSSSWKGVLGGTVLGLGIVTAFVVGARMASSPARPGAAAAQHAPAPVETAVTFAPQAPVVPQAVVPQVLPQTGSPTATAPAANTAVPVIAATALPPAAPARPVTAAVAVARPPAPAAPLPVVAPSPVAQKAAAAPSAAPAASAASTAEAQAAPEDSAPSLVPVLPPSAPAVVDPLVKAVQDDIKEEQGARH